ncbi:tyrosine-protein phosphatase [Streptomyces sp. NA04227]|uniref:tyrosine-protein phosphatase n=1 Tax=Streptomyces sp. NA04227 TaxID=2742136 RepID=UPI0015913D62|nr:tyrosine-protein phosphatase [Streptomyces sp. NA04227]QKW10514.1 tyrosine-protein phosphatase [Streptomyces sp. NA04227]
MRAHRLLPTAPAAVAALALLGLATPAVAVPAAVDGSVPTADVAGATAAEGPGTAPLPGTADVRAAVPGGHIPLEGTVNTRDLGGYSTVTGHQIRDGVLFRSDSLGKLTDNGVTALSRLGLRTVIDFRTPFEIQYDKPDRLPPGLTATARPVSDNGSYRLLLDAIGSRDPQVQQEMLGDGKAEAAMHEIYRTFVTNADSRAAFGATLRQIAEGPANAPLLFHCTSGKDRTGWMSYALLRLLGVPAATAQQDFLHSNTLRAESDRKAREYLKESGAMQNPDLIIPLQEVRTAYLDTALAEIRHTYGTFTRYAVEGLGVDLPTLQRLRARLLR